MVLLSLLAFSVNAYAINGRTTYQAKIYKPDGLPLEAVSVNFRFTVLDPSASCVLFSEDYAAVNMIGSGGLVSFSLGMGTRTYPASGPTTLAAVFDNSVASFVCQSPGIFNPVPTDNRKVVMQFNEGTGWQTLPAMAINSVPYAMYSAKSQNSTLFNGKADSAFVETSTLAALNCQTNEAIKFNGATFSCIPVGAGGSGISSVSTSGSVLVTGGTASAPVISITAVTMSNDGYLTSLDYAEFKSKLSASTTQIVNTLGFAPVSGAAVATQISTQISQAGSSANVVDTLVKRDSSGNVTVTDLYANAAKVNYVDIYRPSTSFNIRLQAPTSLAANYTLNLPTTSGTTGQVLSTDGAGNLSWVNAAGGSVISVSATAPLMSSGGAAPTISITQSTSSTDGYLSSANWNTFNSKQQATSSAIIATLGYTPAHATSATQWSNNSTTVYYNGGYVGIGTGTPSSALEVSGSVLIGHVDTGIVTLGSDTSNAYIELRETDNVGTPYFDFANDPTTDFDFRFILLGKNRFAMQGANIGINENNPTAYLHIIAGTSSTSPLKFSAGPLLTSPQSGALEYDGTHYYVTDNTNTRRTIATGSANNSVDNVSVINSTSNITLNPTGSVVVSSTTASTNATNGALIVKGGLGVAGNINSGGSVQAVSFAATTGMTIGAVTSSSAKLHIGGAANQIDLLIQPFPMGGSDTSRIRFADSDNGSSPMDIVYTDNGGAQLAVMGGNFGVGTALPAEKIDVLGNMRIGNSDSNFIAFRGVAGDGAGIYTHTYIGERRYNGGEASELLLFKGNDSDNGAGPDRVRLAGGNILFDTYASGDTPSGSFEAVATAPAITTKMMINGAGNVGIGTSTPERKLHVSSSTSSDGLLLDNGTVDSSNLIFHDSSQGVSGVTWNMDSSNGTLRIFTEPVTTINPLGAGTGAERMVITPAGNVGVGTTAPNTKLSVGTQGVSDGQIPVQISSVSGTPAFYGAMKDGTYGFTFGYDSSLGGIIRQITTDPIYIQTNNGATNAVTIVSGGSVGIGTVSPTAKLEVAGGDVSIPTGRLNFNARTTAGTAGIALTDSGSIYGEHDLLTETSRMVIEIFDNTNDQIVLRTADFLGLSTHDMMKVQFDQISLAPTTGNVGVGVETPTSKLQVNGGIKQPNFGQIVVSFDGVTRTVSMPAFLTDAYMNTHQDEVFTWRAPSPTLRDSTGCNIGPHANHTFSNADMTWGGVYRLVIGKVGANNVVDLQWAGWGTQLLDPALSVVNTSGNQGLVNTTLLLSGSDWVVEHMQGQVGTTNFACQ